MLRHFNLLDLECVTHHEAEKWLPPVEPDRKLVEEFNTPIQAARNLKDPEKIKADIAAKEARIAMLPALIEQDIAERKAALLEAGALDADLCQIVAFGYQPGHGSRDVVVAQNEKEERIALAFIWSLMKTPHATAVPFIGYGLSFYDLGVLVRRSQLLGVEVPEFIYEQRKYNHPLIVDLADRLTLNGMIEQKKGRGLDYHCKRLGITIEDPHTGKDIADLWKAGDIAGIAAHCVSDLRRISQLAQRLGVIPMASEESEAA